MLILEDLHWADPSTATALEFLARNMSDERLMIVATVRIDEMHPRRPTGELVAALERCPAVRRMNLLRLGDAEVAELVAAIVDGDHEGELAGQNHTRPETWPRWRTPGPEADELIRRVGARSEGNPLFVEELVAGHQDGGGLRPTLRDLLVTRVESLTDAAVDCARLLAVAARPLSHALLATASELAQGELLGGLRQAVDRHVVVADADAYRFRHALVGEALYDHLLPGERAALHGRLAAAMAALPAEGSAAERAHHWVAAGDAGEALVALVRAADVAERALAFSEALASWRAALGLWAQVDDPAGRIGCDRAALLERAGEAASRSERPRHAGASVGSQLAAELTEAALGHVDPGSDPVRAGLLHARLAHHLWTAGRDGQAHADTALRLVPPDPPSSPRARSWPTAPEERSGPTRRTRRQPSPGRPSGWRRRSAIRSSRATPGPRSGRPGRSSAAPARPSPSCAPPCAWPNGPASPTGSCAPSTA